MSGTLPPPPMRRDSDEHTAVVPRDSLPPVSTAPGPTIEQLAECERQRRDAADLTETLVECEGPCKDCPCCGGDRLITDARREAWRKANP